MHRIGCRDLDTTNDTNTPRVAYKKLEILSIITAVLVIYFHRWNCKKYFLRCEVKYFSTTSDIKKLIQQITDTFVWNFYYVHYTLNIYSLELSCNFFPTSKTFFYYVYKQIT